MNGVTTGKEVARVRYGGKKADPFYTSKSWRKLRKAVLERDCYLCQRCRKRPAAIVHHIVPIRDDRELMRQMDNLESVCALCHNQLHPEKGSPVGKAAELPHGVRIMEIG